MRKARQRQSEAPRRQAKQGLCVAMHSNGYEIATNRLAKAKSRSEARRDAKEGLCAARQWQGIAPSRFAKAKNRKGSNDGRRVNKSHYQRESAKYF
nr:MAG TPA: hypothetical protein [Caudoviricetes sp.]